MDLGQIYFTLKRIFIYDKDGYQHTIDNPDPDTMATARNLADNLPWWKKRGQDRYISKELDSYGD